MNLALNGGPFDGTEDHIPTTYDPEFGYPSYYDRADGNGHMHRYVLRLGPIEEPVQYDYQLEV